MIVKRFRGNAYGASLTAAERRAMNEEVNRQILEKDEKYTEDLDAMVLYVLMQEYGWKKKRLHMFWKAFVRVHRALRRYYEMNEPGDGAWLAHRKLNEIGVDVHQWYKEDDIDEQNE